MSLALWFHYLILNMFRMLIHPSSGASDLFVELFHGLYCSGSMCVGVTLWFGWGGVVSGCRLKLYSNSNIRHLSVGNRCQHTALKWHNTGILHMSTILMDHNPEFSGNNFNASLQISRHTTQLFITKIPIEATCFGHIKAVYSYVYCRWVYRSRNVWLCFS